MRDIMRLIIGGSSGFGKYLVDRSIETRQHTIFTYKNNIPDAEHYSNLSEYIWCDLSCTKSITNFTNWVLRQNKPVKDLVFCGARHPSRLDFRLTQLDDFRDIFQVNVLSIVQIIQELLPVMNGESKSSIVILSSKVTRSGGYRIYPYAMAKSALKSMSKPLSKELSVQGIRLNLISPGELNPNSNEHYVIGENMSVSYLQLYEVVEYLLGSTSSGLNGEDLYLDF